MNIRRGVLIYPSGCKPIYPSLEQSDLKKRLEQLNYELRHEEDGTDRAHDYKLLAIHLIDDSFLNHRSKEIQSLVAECITNILRISCPFSPYEDHPEQRKIFLFLIDQVNNLTDLQSESRNRYEAILSTLIHVNAFILALPLEKREEIFTNLFVSMFQILETNEAEELRRLAIALMTSLLEQAEEICKQVLGIVFENLMRRNHTVAKGMLMSLDKSMISFIEKNFVNILSRRDNSHLMDHAYFIATQLNSMCPGFIERILEQLKDSLNSGDTDERAHSVSILANLLSAEQPELKRLIYIKAFYHRFIDKSEGIRVLCVKKCKDFLLKRPELRKEITKRLILMQHDKCNDVRYEVIQTIISAAKENFEILVEEPELFSCLEERSFDSSKEVRRKILKEFTSLYNILSSRDLAEEFQNLRMKILNRVVSSYHSQDEDDKYYIEELVNVYIIHFNLETDERIHELYVFFTLIDNNALKAFVEMLIHQKTFRKLVHELLKQLEEENDRMIERVVRALSSFFPEPEKATENLRKFLNELRRDSQLHEDMKELMDPQASCSSHQSKITLILSKIDDSDESDSYYLTIQMLLLRSASLVIDEEAVVSLINKIKEELRGNDPKSVIKGCYLLEVLSFVFPSYFSHDQVIKKLVALFVVKDSEVTTRILATINNIGIYILDNPSADVNLSTLKMSLKTICKIFPICGTLKQAKQAIKAISIFWPSKNDGFFTELLGKMEELFNPSSTDFQTTIATIGYISTYCSYDSHKIKELMERLMIEIIGPHFEETIQESEKIWCRRDQLPSRTIFKLLAMKSVTRCSLSLDAPNLTKQIFEMFELFIKSKGDIHRGRDDIFPQEKNWLRLQAGTCMLKLCKYRGFDDKMTSEQFYTLSRLMLDEVDEVRTIFAAKLEKGLRAKCPGECLPMDFMGFYALGGLEEEESIKGQLKSYMMGLIRKKKLFLENPLVKGNGEGVEVWSNLLPECVLVYAVPILAHTPKFYDTDDAEQLMMIKNCLEFILQPYLDNNELKEDDITEYYCFFNKLIQKLRHYRDSQRPDDDDFQFKYSAICDIAQLVIDANASENMRTRAETYELPFDPYVPKKYLQLDENLDVSQFSLSAEVLENISMMTIQERRKIAANKRAEIRKMGRTFGVTSQPQKKRKIVNESAASGEPTRKTRRTRRNTK